MRRAGLARCGGRQGLFWSSQSRVCQRRSGGPALHSTLRPVSCFLVLLRLRRALPSRRSHSSGMSGSGSVEIATSAKGHDMRRFGHHTTAAVFFCWVMMSCSPAAPPCSPQTCSMGCCDSAGSCQTSTSTIACGSRGLACQRCEFGSICSLGTCIGNTGGVGGGTAGGVGGGTPGGVGGGTPGGAGGGTAGGVGGGTAGGAGGGSPSCAGTLTRCTLMCVDTEADINNCGRCGGSCGSGQVCNRGRCEVLPADCSAPGASCAPGFGCEPTTRQCVAGCRRNLDCPPGATCSSGTCQCPVGEHACGQRCVSDAAATSCGASCQPCPAAPNAVPSCNGSTCGFRCNPGFFDSNGVCVSWSTCAPGTFVQVEGTSTTNRFCGRCPAGSSSSTTNAPTCSACGPGTFSTFTATSCTPWTTCAAGTFVQGPGSASSNRVCSPCVADTFSSTTNAPSCTSWTTCAPGTFVQTPGTASSDRVCATLPDAGVLPVVNGTFGSCSSVTPCSGNLSGTWARTSLCVRSQTSSGGPVCSTVQLTGYSGSVVGRLDFVGNQVVTSSGGTETISFNFPQVCLMPPVIDCSTVATALMGTCPVAAPPRTGCDCSTTNTSPLSSRAEPWTGSGGVLTVGAGASANTWQTCVIPGTPDVLIVEQPGSRTTWERRR